MSRPARPGSPLSARRVPVGVREPTRRRSPSSRGRPASAPAARDARVRGGDDSGGGAVLAADVWAPAATGTGGRLGFPVADRRGRRRGAGIVFRRRAPRRRTPLCARGACGAERQGKELRSGARAARRAGRSARRQGRRGAKPGVRRPPSRRWTRARRPLGDTGVCGVRRRHLAAEHDVGSGRQWPPT